MKFSNYLNCDRYRSEYTDKYTKRAKTIPKIQITRLRKDILKNRSKHIDTTKACCNSFTLQRLTTLDKILQMRQKAFVIKLINSNLNSTQLGV